MSAIDIKKLSISILGPLLAGGIGSFATASSIPTWYAALNKPPFNPPNWIFGPVWTLLYILMGISLYLVWNSSKKTEAKEKGIMYFWIQIILNLLWSLVFFGLKSPIGGLAIILLLILFIVITMVYFKRVSYLAFLMLVPYILWVSFATILNFSIFLLN